MSLVVRSVGGAAATGVTAMMVAAGAAVLNDMVVAMVTAQRATSQVG